MQFGPENKKGFSSRRYRLVLLCLLCCIPFRAFPAILHFPGHAATIQETIHLAADGDTILLTEGRYFENIVIREKAITLGSEFILDGDSGHISRTIIDGSRWTDSLRRSTISLIECVDTTTIVRGLTITGGSGSQIFVGPAEHWCGGGVIIFESSAKVVDNIIEGNHLNYEYRVNVGAGILAGAADGVEKTDYLTTSCQFRLTGSISWYPGVYLLSLIQAKGGQSFWFIHFSYSAQLFHLYPCSFSAISKCI